VPTFSQSDGGIAGDQVCFVLLYKVVIKTSSKKPDALRHCSSALFGNGVVVGMKVINP